MARRIVWASAAVAAVLAVCQASSAGRGLSHSLVASSGGVTAQLVWRGGSSVEAKGLRILIRRSGRVVTDRRVPSAWGECPRDCVQVRSWSPPLLVRDLDRDGEPEVLLNLYGSGAHCCSISVIYRYVTARGVYTGRRRVWEADYRVRDYDRDGVLDLSSADTRFCFGCSYPMLARPVRIWHYRTGRLVDVTRAFPGVVSFYARVDRREVAHIRRGDGAYHGFPKRRLVEFSRLYLGGYVADTCLLGRCLRGWRFAGALAHGGDLGGGSSTYLKRLHRYLVRLGYWT